MRVLARLTERRGQREPRAEGERTAGLRRQAGLVGAHGQPGGAGREERVRLAPARPRRDRPSRCGRQRGEAGCGRPGVAGIEQGLSLLVARRLAEPRIGEPGLRAGQRRGRLRGAAGFAQRQPERERAAGTRRARRARGPGGACGRLRPRRVAVGERLRALGDPLEPGGEVCRGSVGRPRLRRCDHSHRCGQNHPGQRKCSRSKRLIAPRGTAQKRDPGRAARGVDTW